MHNNKTWSISIMSCSRLAIKKSSIFIFRWVSRWTREQRYVNQSLVYLFVSLSTEKLTGGGHYPQLSPTSRRTITFVYIKLRSIYRKMVGNSTLNVWLCFISATWRWIELAYDFPTSQSPVWKAFDPTGKSCNVSNVWSLWTPTWRSQGD